MELSLLNILKGNELLENGRIDTKRTAWNWLNDLFVNDRLIFCIVCVIVLWPFLIATQCDWLVFISILYHSIFACYYRSFYSLHLSSVTLHLPYFSFHMQLIWCRVNCRLKRSTIDLFSIASMHLICLSRLNASSSSISRSLCLSLTHFCLSIAWSHMCSTLYKNTEWEHKREDARWGMKEGSGGGELGETCSGEKRLR